MKRKFIVNPQAGSGDFKRRLEELKSEVTRRAGSFDFVVTAAPGDAEALARQAIRDGYEQIIALGGDGTIHEVANGFFEKGIALPTSACLAVSAWGTGSDYIRTVYRGASRSDWLDGLLHPDIRPVDVGRAEFSSGVTRIFVNMGGVGISSEIVKGKKSSSFIPGALSYLVPTVKNLVTYRPKVARVELDGRVLETELVGLFIAKGRYAGGGMLFAPHAVLDDGQFAVTAFTAMKPAEMVLKLAKLYIGSLEGETQIVQATAKVVSVTSSEPVGVELDGEIEGTTNLRAEVLPRALRLCFPVI